MSFWRLNRVGGLFGIGFLLFAVAGTAGAEAPKSDDDVKPGDVITKENVDKIKHLVTPSIEWVVKWGATIKINEYRPVEWPRLYREATEKYAAQVALSEDGLSLSNHVAGMPFPNVDANDPKAALKIMWNYEYRPYPGTDDFVEFDFPAISAAISRESPAKVDRVFELGDSRRLYYNARVAVDPKPELPNPKGYRYQDVLNVLAPYDLKGLGAVTYRYLDASKQDDTFLYMPSLRRVRRLSTAQRSSALFGQDADPDSYWGYSGHIGWMDWSFLGEKVMLGTVHGQEHPMKQCPPPADFMYCDVWEKRNVYAIEGRSKLPQYAYGKRVIFIDKESYIVTYEDIYDQAGELWKVWIDNYSFTKQLDLPEAPKFEEEQGYYMGFVMADMQLHHVTWSPHPGPNTARDGWWFNEGANARTKSTPEGSVPEAFSVSRMIARGQ